MRRTNSKKLLACTLSVALTLQGCGTPAATTQTTDTGSASTAAETAATDPLSDVDASAAPDSGLAEKLQDAVYDYIVHDLDEAEAQDTQGAQDLEVQEVKTVYLSKEYLEQYSFNTKETKFFGSTLGELEAQFGDEKYVFDLDENGKTVVHAVDDFDNTFEEVSKVALAGAGVILVCVTIGVATGGVAPTTALVACSAKAAGPIAAAAPTIALMATKTAVTIYNGGDVVEEASDLVFDLSENLVVDAIGGTLTA